MVRMQEKALAVAQLRTKTNTCTKSCSAWFWTKTYIWRNGKEIQETLPFDSTANIKKTANQYFVPGTVKDEFRTAIWSPMCGRSRWLHHSYIKICVKKERNVGGCSHGPQNGPTVASVNPLNVHQLCRDQGWWTGTWGRSQLVPPRPFICPLVMQEA